MRDKITEFKQLLDQFDDDFDRVHTIMDLAQGHSDVNSAPATATKVPGCQSTLLVWGSQSLCHRWQFSAVSDGLFTAGMAQLVINAVNGHTTEELGDLAVDWFKELNLPGLITQGRMNGFANLLKVIRDTVNQG